MYFPEFKRLRAANPDQARTIDDLDRYLSSLTGSERHHISARTVAEALHASHDKIVGLLMAATNLGLLKLKFRVICPQSEAGIRDYEDINDIPTEIECDICGEAHQVTADDIEYFFELNEKNAPVSR